MTHQIFILNFYIIKLPTLVLIIYLKKWEFNAMSEKTVNRNFVYIIKSFLALLGLTLITYRKIKSGNYP